MRATLTKPTCCAYSKNQATALWFSREFSESLLSVPRVLGAYDYLNPEALPANSMISKLVACLGVPKMLISVMKFRHRPIERVEGII